MDRHAEMLARFAEYQALCTHPYDVELRPVPNRYFFGPAEGIAPPVEREVAYRRYQAARSRWQHERREA